MSAQQKEDRLFENIYTDYMGERYWLTNKKKIVYSKTSTFPTFQK